MPTLRCRQHSEGPYLSGRGNGAGSTLHFNSWLRTFADRKPLLFWLASDTLLSGRPHTSKCMCSVRGYHLLQINVAQALQVQLEGHAHIRCCTAATASNARHFELTQSECRSINI
jgi:hypothetical protein